MLIKCPECNKDISDKALFCPHCGYPFDNKLNNINQMVKNTKKEEHNVINAPKPKNDEWTEKWLYKPSHSKAISFIIFFILLLISIVFIVLTVQESKKDDIITNYGIYMSFSVFFGIVTFMSFVIAIIGLFVVKVKIVSINEYNVVVYCGLWKNYLIIEDELVEAGFTSSFHNTQLTGKLPNGKKVVATISSGAIDFEVK